MLDPVSAANHLQLGLFSLVALLSCSLNVSRRFAKRQAEKILLSAQRHSQTLNRSEELYCLMVENVKDYAMFLLDPSGGIASWNVGAQSILGYQAAEIIGQPFSRLFTSEDIQRGQPEHELQTAVTLGRAVEEGWHLRQDGTRFWGSGILMALIDEAGNLRGFAKVLRDLTERKLAEEAQTKSIEELAKLNRLKDDFLSTVSHELRTPITNMKMAIHLLKIAPITSTREQYLEILQTECEREAQLIDDLLDLQRLEATSNYISLSPLSLQDCLPGMISPFRSRTYSLGQTLQVNLPLAACRREEFSYSIEGLSSGT